MNENKLSPKMVEALQSAQSRWDSALTCDVRTWGALYRRGLVDVRRGRGTDKRGFTAYDVVVGVKINDKGRMAIA